MKEYLNQGSQLILIMGTIQVVYETDHSTEIASAKVGNSTFSGSFTFFLYLKITLKN